MKQKSGWKIIEKTIEYNLEIRNEYENGCQAPKFEDFSKKVIEIVHSEDYPVDEKTVLQFIRHTKNS